MDKGVCFIAFGESYLARLQVAIYSLRQHYDGPVTVFKDIENKEIDQFFKAYGVDTKELLVSDPDLSKVEVMERTPYENSLYLDADCLVHRSIDGLLDIVEEKQLAAVNYMDFPPTTPFLSNRFMTFEDLGELYLDIFKMPVTIVGSCFGWSKKSNAVLAMRQYFEAAIERGSEYAFDICLHMIFTQMEFWIFGPAQFMSSSYNNDGIEPTITHFHGNRHCKEGCLHAHKWITSYYSLKKSWKVYDKKDAALQRFLQK